MGLKVRDPSVMGLMELPDSYLEQRNLTRPSSEKDAWVIFHERTTWNSLIWNFGVGYPF